MTSMRRDDVASTSKRHFADMCLLGKDKSKPKWFADQDADLQLILKPTCFESGMVLY